MDGPGAHFALCFDRLTQMGFTSRMLSGVPALGVGLDVGYGLNTP